MSATKFVPIFESILDARGTKLDKFEGRGSTLLLYGLGPKAVAASGAGEIAP
jgi:hypothetical protein